MQALPRPPDTNTIVQFGFHTLSSYCSNPSGWNKGGLSSGAMENVSRLEKEPMVIIDYDTWATDFVFFVFFRLKLDPNK